MNQNSTASDDLQKAIDDITKSTIQDPVFADPVAAPSSVPEGDTGELAESVGPFPAPKSMPVPPRPPMPPRPAATVTAQSNAVADFSIPPIQSEPEIPTEPVAEESAVVTETLRPSGLSVHEIKTAALRDLAPLVDKMNLPASQRFSIYRDMFENLRDYTAIEPAYQAAKEILDDHERGEALLYLVESIDNM